MAEYDFDLIVVGSGPSGHQAAIASAKLGKRVAIVEKMRNVGGVSVTTGTIPSKTMREAALYLSGIRERHFYGFSYRTKENVSAEDLIQRTQLVIAREWDILRSQLERNGIQLFQGEAKFVDAETIEFVRKDETTRLKGRFIIIAVGSRPASPPGVEMDGETIVNSDTILDLKRIPKTLTCIGGGVIGLEYASIFAVLGVQVTVIDQSAQLLSFVEREIVDSLIYQMRDMKVIFRLGEGVRNVRIEDSVGVAGYGGLGSPAQKQAIIELTSGKVVASDMALYSIGRQGCADLLNVEKAGLTHDSRGRLKVNSNYQTEVPHIYAVGDVIGFPSLASTSLEQGRHAALHAFEVIESSMPTMYPYGIYTIPEISTVGATEEELTAKAIPYEIGIARYREIARGQILGDDSGLLKLLVGRADRKLLGVHAIGTGSTELIHIGQAVIAFNGTIDYLINAVFNYPTLAECYKNAALDASNRLTAM